MMDGVPERLEAADYPVAIHVKPAIEGRNRLTAAFRFFLALPHLILVGAPAVTVATVSWSMDRGSLELSSGSGGLVSVVIAFAVLFAWLALVVTARHPDALWRVCAWYMRWRVKAIAYATLLRDEYPPFGDGEYPLNLEVPRPEEPRSRLTVFFRLLLALPHLFVLGFLGVAWSFTTAVAWVMILFTGRYPGPLYGFALGVLAWTTRVEAYTLLLRDEYPPFTLRT